MASYESPTSSAASVQCPPGSRFPLLPGVRSRMVRTSRLEQHCYESGADGAEPLLLVHGNASSARFFEQLMAALPQFHILAPDLRGYGASEAKVADATRGLRDYSDDLEALVRTLGWERFHLLGWSLGGVIVMQYVVDYPRRVRTLTLHAPGSPFGYGGTRDAAGTPNYDDFAGSGGGLIAPQVVERYLAKDETANSPFSPRSGLRNVIVKPTFTFVPEREDALVEQMLMMAIGEQHYPGDKLPRPTGRTADRASMARTTHSRRSTATRARWVSCAVGRRFSGCMAATICSSATPRWPIPPRSVSSARSPAGRAMRSAHRSPCWRRSAPCWIAIRPTAASTSSTCSTTAATRRCSRSRPSSRPC